MKPSTPTPTTDPASSPTAPGSPMVQRPRPQTLSLFEREMRDQVAAARDAVATADTRSDPLLLQAAQSHLEGLLDLARRNGVVVDAPDLATS